jgi:hypothetical protein
VVLVGKMAVLAVGEDVDREGKHPCVTNLKMCHQMLAVVEIEETERSGILNDLGQLVSLCLLHVLMILKVNSPVLGEAKTNALVEIHHS